MFLNIWHVTNFFFINYHKNFSDKKESWVGKFRKTWSREEILEVKKKGIGWVATSWLGKWVGLVFKRVSKDKGHELLEFVEISMSLQKLGRKQNYVANSQYNQ